MWCVRWCDVQRQWLGIIIVATGLAFSAIEEIFAPGVWPLPTHPFPRPCRAPSSPRCEALSAPWLHVRPPLRPPHRALPAASVPSLPPVCPSPAAVHATHVLFGCAMSLLSALILSFDDVVAEAAMSAPNAPSSQQVTARMGSTATALCGSYVVRIQGVVCVGGGGGVAWCTVAPFPLPPPPRSCRPTSPRPAPPRHPPCRGPTPRPASPRPASPRPASPRPASPRPAPPRVVIVVMGLLLRRAASRRCW
jgi:hypothetical protein